MSDPRDSTRSRIEATLHAAGAIFVERTAKGQACGFASRKAGNGNKPNNVNAAEPYRHAWLHDGCWEQWYEREAAAQSRIGGDGNRKSADSVSWTVYAMALLISGLRRLLANRLLAGSLTCAKRLTRLGNV